VILYFLKWRGISYLEKAEYCWNFQGKARGRDGRSHQGGTVATTTAHGGHHDRGWVHSCARRGSLATLVLPNFLGSKHHR